MPTSITPNCQTSFEDITIDEKPIGENAEQDERKKDPNSYLTLTGTIKRSKKSGQKPSDDVSVTIKTKDIASTIIMVTPSSDDTIPEETCPTCQMIRYFLTLVWSIACSPFVFLLSTLYSIYMGSITWCNVFTLYSEEKPVLTRITVSPLLLLFYPLFIVSCGLGLGFYSCCVQITYDWSVWSNEVRDLEKGFYGWLCRSVSLEDCSPYEEIVITQVKETSGVKPSVTN